MEVLMMSTIHSIKICSTEIEKSIVLELQANYHEVKIKAIKYGPNVPKRYKGSVKLYMPNTCKDGNGKELQGVAVFFDESNHIQEIVTVEKKSKEEYK
jgi:hypothetical protein